jgi:hypothetical protein
MLMFCNSVLLKPVVPVVPVADRYRPHLTRNRHRVDAFFIQLQPSDTGHPSPKPDSQRQADDEIQHIYTTDDCLHVDDMYYDEFKSS